MQDSHKLQWFGSLAVVIDIQNSLHFFLDKNHVFPLCFTCVTNLRIYLPREHKVLRESRGLQPVLTVRVQQIRTFLVNVALVERHVSWRLIRSDQFESRISWSRPQLGYMRCSKVERIAWIIMQSASARRGLQPQHSAGDTMRCAPVVCLYLRKSQGGYRHLQ